jgi:hypothetical protein
MRIVNGEATDGTKNLPTGDVSIGCYAISTRNPWGANYGWYKIVKCGKHFCLFRAMPPDVVATSDVGCKGYRGSPICSGGTCETISSKHNLPSRERRHDDDLSVGTFLKFVVVDCGSHLGVSQVPRPFLLPVVARCFPPRTNIARIHPLLCNPPCPL